MRAALLMVYLLAVPVAGAQAGGDPSAGKTAFGATCAGCHSISAAASSVGPHLDGVLGRQAGSVSGATYSDAMKQAKFKWTTTKLDAFLANPQAVVPGTTMPVSVPDKKTRADIIAYLASLRT
jgi:cytochrome c